jgi:glutamine amidotransferase
VQSLQFALNRIGIDAVITDDSRVIKDADKVIFPGVGEASTAMKYLQDRGLDEVIKELNQPVLGICLGMQLLCEASGEGNTKCLGIFDIQVRQFVDLKVPHVGWNEIESTSSRLFDTLPSNPYCYFVHSYYAEINAHTIANTNYGVSFSSAIQLNNFYGVQFHPEKSSAIGEQILKNFLSL